MTEHTFTKEAPGLVIVLMVGIIGFFLSIGWGTATGRKMDRDTKMFLAKMWSGIVLFGIVLMFIM